MKMDSIIEPLLDGMQLELLALQKIAQPLHIARSEDFVTPPSKRVIFKYPRAVLKAI